MPTIFKDTLKTAYDTVPYKPSKERSDVGEFVKNRMEVLKEYRRQLRIEDEWRSADNEIIPRPLSQHGQSRILASSEEDGLRARLVPVNDETQDWRQDSSDPMLLVKIQTALSIIIDSVPEALLRATLKRYEETASIAKAIWERNWHLSGAKEVYKLVAFDVFKYGFGVGRTYPRDLRYDKQVIDELNLENPEDNVYSKKENILYADIARERLDPYRVWLDPATKPYDRLSCNEVYYEVDYSEDDFRMEFGVYPNHKSVVATFAESDIQSGGAGEVEDIKRRKQVVVGFYENRKRDLYVIFIPSQGIVLHYSPILNDDGNLSPWYCMNMLRSADSPYGISTWQIIRQDKELYDKMKNMTMDQLVLSIQKMGFIIGANNLSGDNVFRIVPGKFQQLPSTSEVKFLEIPGPGRDAFQGLGVIKNIIDDNSGITPTLQGDLTKGTTLGEVLHAKESALKRLRTPLENLACAMQDDVYLTLSWAKQVYSVPEIRKFVSINDIKRYEEENKMKYNEIFLTKVDESTGEPMEFSATFMPQLNLKLEKSGGKYIESKDERFFQIGVDLPLSALEWKGIVKVVPSSIASPSTELDKQSKMALFNIIAPLLGQPPEIFAPSVSQLLYANDAKPEDWLPENWVKYIRGDMKKSLFVMPVPMGPDGQPLPPQEGSGAMMSDSGRLPGGFESMQGQAGITPIPGAPTIVPQSQPGGEMPGTMSESINNSLGR